MICLTIGANVEHKTRWSLKVILSEQTHLKVKRCSKGPNVFPISYTIHFEKEKCSSEIVLSEKGNTMISKVAQLGLMETILPMLSTLPDALLYSGL